MPYRIGQIVQGVLGVAPPKIPPADPRDGQQEQKGEQGPRAPHAQRQSQDDGRGGGRDIVTSVGPVQRFRIYPHSPVMEFVWGAITTRGGGTTPGTYDTTETTLDTYGTPTPLNTPTLVAPDVSRAATEWRADRHTSIRFPEQRYGPMAGVPIVEYLVDKAAPDTTIARRIYVPQRIVTGTMDYSPRAVSFDSLYTSPTYGFMQIARGNGGAYVGPRAFVDRSSGRPVRIDRPYYVYGGTDEVFTTTYTQDTPNTVGQSYFITNPGSMDRDGVIQPDLPEELLLPYNQGDVTVYGGSATSRTITPVGPRAERPNGYPDGQPDPDPEPDPEPGPDPEVPEPEPRPTPVANVKLIVDAYEVVGQGADESITYSSIFYDVVYDVPGSPTQEHIEAQLSFEDDRRVTSSLIFESQFVILERGTVAYRIDDIRAQPGGTYRVSLVRDLGQRPVDPNPRDG